MSLTSFAPAKVNLYLHVTGKRSDGYHLLDSLAVFPAVGDKVTVSEAASLSLSLSGPFGAALEGEADNLLLQAARSLAQDSGAALALEKNLPVASGIGGGSADAAACLRALCKLWGVQGADLPALALHLGADVPVCLRSIPARMQGIGEVLAPAPRLPEFGMVLVNPGVAVPTPSVFKARRGGFTPAPMLPAIWPNAAAMASALKRCTNDLQAAAITIQPVIGEVLATLSTLPGVLLARMSGSGATCFALFATPAEAEAAAAQIPQESWWRWGGGLYQPPQTGL
ncbi:4-(cytidine 5'-diphospho)-2-C-methyl-D-erythritol kinase [Acidocella aminolytica]|jgi:4-diphosphocytidyl-2-C-methyl-D-erythritol kinase|uniref:4-diphosphocytidyl-2-C-methyl-D-erythritol kinase n=1 Tax=Acidocella aminolytica 101 = DSM 11237 TaxID=1120923 RepID=A0A0D6PJG4_9PROT|nr:4-(cytidine 5'-diphospho)-2-C-methyl-D-erythritol kinase [Acidocella aminolytica]GAN81915.1 4-diphosphocytidyl-2-C-methyl-D-erythritol kinase [Acidocella aminolytica 101 = DSM 11237]GBQ42663.1 4-diphosphocytidyl-2-C-methyl-D-erythritol kinase [Acidocella aminolytica 101 = DSM 11237]SHF21108.1 4-diphosphocytidyl-2-C-methyl-D-erythritol kinase [Acidocella aminolytica 101 = DSM 11237]